MDRFLEPFTECASVSEFKKILHLIKTDALKTTVSECTPCNVVSLSTTSVNFNTPREQNAEGSTRSKHRTRQFCQLILVSTIQCVQALVYDHSLVLKFRKCLLSAIARSWVRNKVSPRLADSQHSQKCSLHLGFALLLFFFSPPVMIRSS